MEILPKILYKYMNWSGRPRDKKKNILFKNILYFSSPLAFNDPFDSMLPIIFDEGYRNSEKFHRDFLLADNMIGKTRYSKQEIDEIAKDRFLNPHKIKYDTDIMTKSIQKSIVERVRISCFTTKKDNVLMWSHYADCHRGICIGLSTDYMQEGQLFMYAKVNYSKNFPKLKQLNNNSLMYTKSLDWKYENEYRMINIDAYDQIIFPKRAVHDVVIGYKMDENLKQSLVTYLQKKYPGVRISVSRPNQTMFKMDIIPV